MRSKILFLCLFLVYYADLSADANLIAKALNIQKAIPKENQQIKITLTIQNTSKKTVKNVKVVFYWKRGNSKYTLIKELTSIKIDGMSEKEISIRWKTHKNGFYTIKANIDTKEEIEDDIKKDNTITRTFPVTVREFYFVALIYGYEKEGWWEPAKKMQYITTVNAIIQTKKQQEYWLKRGILPCKLVSRRTPDISFDNLVKYWSEPLSLGLKGIAIDEIGFYPGGRREKWGKKLLNALKTIKEKFPESYIIVWNAGPLNLEEISVYRYYADLIIEEVYTQYKQFAFKTHRPYKYFEYPIDIARKYDILQKTIIGFWLTPDHGGISKEEFENQIRFIRQLAPESPGFAFYAGGGRYIKGMNKFVDQIAFKYFIKPVITLWEEDIVFENFYPKPNEPNKITISIHNIGGIDSGAIVLKVKDISEKGIILIEEKRIKTIPAGEKEISFKYSSGAKGKGILPIGREKVEINWRVKSADYHTICAEIYSGPENTILNGKICKTILVQK